MRETEVHNEVAALLLSTVTNTVYLKLLGKALFHALNHIGDKSAGKTVERTMLLIVARTGNYYLAALNRNGKLIGKSVVKLTLGTFSRYFSALDLNGNSGRNSYRLSSYS